MPRARSWRLPMWSRVHGSGIVSSPVLRWKESAMPPIVPNRFLVRVCHPCPFVKDAPRDTDEDERLVELPETARLDNFAALDEKENFADVRLAWNDFGLAVQVEVRGKEQEPVGDGDKPSGSDGLRL